MLDENLKSQLKAYLVEVEEMKAAARRSRNPEAGTLRLGIFPTLALYFLPHAVPRIRETFPGLETLLIEEKSDSLLSRLNDGNLDAAILALPVSDERLTTEVLFTERFLLAVPATHPLAKRTALVLDDLNGYNLMLLEEGHCLRDQALDVCRLAGASERASFRATSLETLRQMVGADVGITLLPELATLASGSGNIRLRRFTDSSPSRQVCICWRNGSAMRHFLPEIAVLLRDVSQRLLAAASTPALD
jgi:LysR family hydrogen peroxide-inducible transcriptional activator